MLHHFLCAAAAALTIGASGHAHALILVDPGPVGVDADGSITFSAPFSGTVPSSGTLSGGDEIAFTDNKFIRYTGTGLSTTIDFALSNNTTVTLTEPFGQFQDISLTDMMGNTVGNDSDSAFADADSFTLFAEQVINGGATSFDIFSISFVFDVSANPSVDITGLTVNIVDTSETGTLEILEKAVVPVPMSLPFLLAGLAGLGWVARRRSAEA
ncbi:MAG: VPLPA-CTERM sorting domain-containing protein [Pseudomonadota bacterium]